MKQYSTLLLIGAASVGLGLGMPSCPGQQAMQQQIDSLQATNAELAKKVSTLTTQMTSVNSDIGQIKNLLPQMTNVISGQKGALDKLQSDVTAIQAKLHTKGGAKKR